MTDKSAARLAPALQAQLTAALAQHQRGELAAAEAGYRAVLGAAPRCFDAAHLLGALLTQRGALDEAIALLRLACELAPAQNVVRYRLARAQLEKRDAAGAVATCERLVALEPQNPEAWLLLGNARQLGAAHAAALDSYEQALRLQPSLAPALNNMAHSLRLLRRTDSALAALARALALKPDYALAWNNRGLALLDLGRAAEALTCFDEALARAPRFPEALSNRGTTLLELKRPTEAAATFASLVELAPGFGGALGNLLYARRSSCDWREYEPLVERIRAAVRRGEFVDAPLSFMCASDSAGAQRRCAQTFAAIHYPGAPAIEPARRPAMATAHRPRRETICVAYLSGDFGEHAVAHLLKGVIEHHDRRRIETLAVSWGRQNEGPTRRRLEAAFGRFVDATALSDREIAALLRDAGADIAVDLMGHTAGQRTGIFAHRGAPLQVSYLGFPGTSGTAYLDYLIADAVVVPPGTDSDYTECIVRLPDSYLPNDASRTIAAASPSRDAVGLPPTGFVFCAFNNPLKITPEVYAVWMGLLREVRGSVLWLRTAAPAVRSNLEQAAARHGVDSARLVFAPPLPAMDEHLARHRLADLFLDTLPYNAHATACDALWAGLPVLTCRGGSFAGRVGASVLTAVGLPELITDSLESYARLALALADDAARLADIRARLAQRRAASPLFDTRGYCRHLEAAYAAMVERARAGLAPGSFTVAGENEDRSTDGSAPS